MKISNQKKHPKFGDPKTQKCRQNGYQNASQIDEKNALTINTKTGVTKDHENQKK